MTKGLRGFLFVLLVAPLPFYQNCSPAMSVATKTSVANEGAGTSHPVPEPPPDTSQGAPTPTATPLPVASATPSPTPSATPSGKMVEVVVAQGEFGRTTMSCDSGKTWRYDRNFMTDAAPQVCGKTAPVRCGSTSCTYIADAATGACKTDATCTCSDISMVHKGIAFGNGYFIANFSWGGPHSYLRSKNGKDWENFIPKDGGVGYGDIAFGNGKFLLPTREGSRSSVDGTTWKTLPTMDLRDSGNPSWVVRRLFFFTHNGVGTFWASGNADLITSVDTANTWQRPMSLAPECGSPMLFSGGSAYGNGLLVNVTSEGIACASSDGGRSWRKSSVGVSAVSSHVVFDGTQFLVWSDAGGSFNRLSSTDGLSWTKTAMTTKVTVAAVIRMTDGTLVATNGLWTAYESQGFLYSLDGLKWSEGMQSSPVDGRQNVQKLAKGLIPAFPGCGM